MSQKSQKQPLKHQNHARPITRRQLLGQGFIAGSAMAFASPLSLLFGPRAMAQVTAPKIPFLSIDLGGGGNIAGSNVMVGKRGGQLDFLQSYSQLGLPAEMHPSRPGQLNTSMGLAFHGDSAFLRGILSVASASTLANVDGFVVPGFSLDDSFENQMSPCHWIHTWGHKGTLASLIGTNQTPSGGAHKVPESSFLPALKPIIVNGPGAAVNMATVGGMQAHHYTGRGNNARADRVLASVEKLNELILGRVPDRDLPPVHKDNIRKSFGALHSALDVDKNALNPSTDAACLALYPTIQNPPPSDEGAMALSITKLLLDGYAGCGGLSLGGFDYHTSERATGERADFRAGKVIGWALELAARKGKHLFIQVSSDGAQNSYRASIDNSADGRGKLGWMVDSGSHAATFVLVYRAGGAGRPPMLNASRQYGAFVEGGGVDMAASPVAGLPDRQAALVFLNYLALHGAQGDFAGMLGTSNPLPAPLDKHLFFGKIT